MTRNIRKSFLKLPDKQAYDLMAAVRGPDGEGKTLKQLLTARIRAIIFKDAYLPHSPGAFQIDSFSDGNLSQLKQTLDNNSTSWHFMTHLLHAVESSKRHPIWGGHGPVIYAMLAEKLRMRGIAGNR